MNVGSLDEFVSAKYDRVLVSLCRTKKAGVDLMERKMVEFVEAKVG
eukprot:CAMPEP_0202962598 /NCGR_PEP_ID=MMETSP1396-20130829/6707_1 /ASSEMBLY_ACC=CAM_ASM_000872 /TAXON_ID= /ORGANISM="Pseudokeronopsis sp., Strain Brazil" /LENGTH=45 /DNA_ID= /DNA_START= /DNA_END= /DNA_ORIENTATION=